MKHNTYFRSKKARMAFMLALTLLLQVFMPIMKVNAATYSNVAILRDHAINAYDIVHSGDVFTAYNVYDGTNEPAGATNWFAVMNNYSTIASNVSSYTIPTDKQFVFIRTDFSSTGGGINTEPMLHLLELYKVIFDYNGGAGSLSFALLKRSFGGSNISTYGMMVNDGAPKYTSDYQFGLPTPTRDGYTFDGWYTAAEGGTRVTNDTQFNGTSDITLYAHWSRYSSYTVNDNLTYNGTEQTGITFDSDTVTCVGTYKATNAGTYTATLTPKNDYTWSDGTTESKEVTWTISPGTIPDETIKFEDKEVTYDGEEHSITVTGELSGGTVEYSLDNTSWSSTLPKFTDAGEYPIHYKASKTNYEKSGTATLTINKKAITPEIAIDKTEFTYNGSVQQPVVSVKLDNANIPAAEFNAVYTSDSTNIGNKSVTVSSSNHNYTFDSAVLNYVINPKAIDGSMVTIENPEYVYDNTNKTPVVTLKDGANTLAVNTDYEILSTSTTTAKECGDYNIIVQGKGNYTGQYTIPWAIVPDAPPVISGATNGASYGGGTTINLSVSDISGLASVTINGESKPVTGNTYTQTISGAGSYTITATDTAGHTSTLSFTIKSGGSGGSGGSGDSGGSGGSGGGSSGGGGSNNPSGNTPSSDNGNKPADNNVPSNNPDNNQPSDTARNNKKTSDSKSNNQTSNNGQDDESIDDKDSEGSTTNDKEDVTTNVTNDDFNRIFFNEERTISYGDGTVIVSVDVEDELGEKADYSGSIVGDTESITKAVLTQDDIDAVSSGETVYIKLVVTLISEDVPQTDKEQIEAALTTIADQELIPGTYYDLKVMKSIGGGDWEKLTTLNDDIEITLDIDKDLQADGRTFYILRSHEGAVTMLFDLDEEPDTITISSRYFSTYALVYTDSPDVAEPVSEKHNCFMHWFILAAALIGEILALRRHEDKKKLLIGTECVDIVIMLALAIIGSCMWDWIIFAIGTAAIVLTVFLPHES